MIQATRQRKVSQPTPQAKRFDGRYHSPAKWRVTHQKMTRGVQNELIDSFQQRTRKLEKKMLDLAPDSDAFRLAQKERRDALDLVEEWKKTPLLRPREGLRMADRT